VPNIFRSLVWRFLNVNFLALMISKELVNLRRICAPLATDPTRWEWLMKLRYTSKSVPEEESHKRNRCRCVLMWSLHPDVSSKHLLNHTEETGNDDFLFPYQSIYIHVNVLHQSGRFPLLPTVKFRRRVCQASFAVLKWGLRFQIAQK